MLKPLVDALEPLLDPIELLVHALELLVDALKPLVDMPEPIPHLLADREVLGIVSGGAVPNGLEQVIQPFVGPDGSVRAGCHGARVSCRLADSVKSEGLVTQLFVDRD